MNDITDLFNEIGHSVAGEPPASVVDADIQRGRHALAESRRRVRTRGAVVAAAVIGAVAVAGVATGQFDTSGSSHPTAANAAPTTTPPVAKTTATEAPPSKVVAVRLIAYTGKQLDGFTVDRVPEGWHLSGSTQYALTINAAGNTNTDPDVFEGKLTVLLQSQDASGLPSGQPVTVNGHRGVVTDDGGQALTYNDGESHTVVVQAPAQLSWSNAEIVSFAEGVHVTGSAIAGRG